MFEKGSIIQYFRQKKGLTQDELGHGICSKTHLSKIERGLTEVSDETISLLCARMGFNIDEEINKLKNVEKLLVTLQKQIIFQEKERALGIIDQLENQEFSYITPLHFRYLLLKTRQFILDNKLEQAKKVLFSKEIQNQKIPQLEENLLNHTLGIYYIQTNDIQQSLIYLKKISLETFNNPEVNYHLALAYYFCDAHISSYYHSQKAKEYFVQTNNFNRILDTESMLLMLLEDEGHIDFYDIQSKYENLIEIAEKIESVNRQQYLLHNFAYQLYKNKKYELACNYYQLAINLSTNMVKYLTSHFGYMRCILEANLKSEHEILMIIKEGLEKSKSSKDQYYENLYTLYLYKIKQDSKNYFLFLEESVLPFLYKIGNKAFFNEFSNELSQHYIENSNSEKLLLLFINYKIHVTTED